MEASNWRLFLVSSLVTLLRSYARILNRFRGWHTRLLQEVGIWIRWSVYEQVVAIIIKLGNHYFNVVKGNNLV